MQCCTLQNMFLSLSKLRGFLCQHICTYLKGKLPFNLMISTPMCLICLLRCGSARNKVRAIRTSVCVCDMLMLVMVFSFINPPLSRPKMTVKVHVVLYERGNDVLLLLLLLLCSRIPASPGEPDEIHLQQQVISGRCHSCSSLYHKCADAVLMWNLCPEFEEPLNIQISFQTDY